MRSVLPSNINADALLAQFELFTSAESREFLAILADVVGYLDCLSYDRFVSDDVTYLLTPWLLDLYMITLIM